MAQKKASTLLPDFCWPIPPNKKTGLLTSRLYPDQFPLWILQAIFGRIFLTTTHGVLSSKLIGVVEESSSFDLRVSDLSRDVFSLHSLANQGISFSRFKNILNLKGLKY
jgi:hypothetical protein